MLHNVMGWGYALIMNKTHHCFALLHVSLVFFFLLLCYTAHFADTCIKCTGVKDPCMFKSLLSMQKQVKNKLFYTNMHDVVNACFIIASTIGSVRPGIHVSSSGGIIRHVASTTTWTDWGLLHAFRWTHWIGGHTCCRCHCLVHGFLTYYCLCMPFMN